MLNMSAHSPSILTANISQPEHDRVVREFEELLGEPSSHGQAMMLSSDPPVHIEVALSLASYKTIFGGAAAAFVLSYFKKLGDKVADSTPNAIRRFIAICRSLADRIGQPVIVRLRLPGPGTRSTTLVLPSGPASEAEKCLAFFVSQMPGINQAIKTLIGVEILGEVRIEVDEKSFSLKWLDSKEFRAYTRSFASDGTPMGSAKLTA
jgi:hypothetical protein